MSKWLILAFTTVSACTSGNECKSCLEEKCSDLLAVCDLNLDCSCMADCLGEVKVSGAERCLSTCGLEEFPAAYGALEACVATACPDSGDECATPDDYVAPSALTCETSGSSIGVGAEADCGFDDSIAFDGDGEILQLVSSSGDVCVRVDRENRGSGQLANTEWGFRELRVGPLGEVVTIEAADGCFYSSHHNFRDVIHGWFGSRRYDLLLREDGHGGSRTYDLFVFDGESVTTACSAAIEGDDCVEGPIVLRPYTP